MQHAYTWSGTYERRFVQPSGRLTNLFGAMVTGVGDRMRSAMMDGMELGGEAAAAVIVIGHSPDLSIDQLAKILGLSHPGTVRLIDRLASAGLAERKSGSRDRRIINLSLTAAGTARRKEILDQRDAALSELLAEFAPDHLAALEQIAETLVRSLPFDAASALAVCRFCNEQNCSDCPMDAFLPAGMAGNTREK